MYLVVFAFESDFFQFKRKKCFKIFVRNLKNSSEALKILCFWVWKKILLPCANADFKINMSEMYGFLRINQLFKETFCHVFICSLQIYKKFLQLLTNQGLQVKLRRPHKSFTHNLTLLKAGKSPEQFTVSSILPNKEQNKLS